MGRTSSTSWLANDEQPLLFHTGHRATIPLPAEAIATVTPLDRLRWITCGHGEADECGAMNELLDCSIPGRGGTRGARLHGVAQRLGRSDAPAAHRRPGHRAGLTSCPAHRHAARPPRTGGPGSSTRRQPTHCCVETYSPNSATGRRSRPTTSPGPPRRQRMSGAAASRQRPLPNFRRLADLGPTTARRHARS